MEIDNEQTLLMVLINSPTLVAKDSQQFIYLNEKKVVPADGAYILRRTNQQSYDRRRDGGYC